ncbi:MAG: hypothetical protein D3910_11845 [Candidatus Electrothrix sp. ATG2]|nr:hypothetical protein [Candidatus Electrothrix sp. ATG2]
MLEQAAQAGIAVLTTEQICLIITLLGSCIKGITIRRKKKNIMIPVGFQIFLHQILCFALSLGHNNLLQSTVGNQTPVQSFNINRRIGRQLIHTCCTDLMQSTCLASQGQLNIRSCMGLTNMTFLNHSIGTEAR